MLFSFRVPVQADHGKQTNKQTNKLGLPRQQSGPYYVLAVTLAVASESTTYLLLIVMQFRHHPSISSTKFALNAQPYISFRQTVTINTVFYHKTMFYPMIRMVHTLFSCTVLFVWNQAHNHAWGSTLLVFKTLSKVHCISDKFIIIRLWPSS